MWEGPQGGAPLASLAQRLPRSQDSVITQLRHHSRVSVLLLLAAFALPRSERHSCGDGEDSDTTATPPSAQERSGRQKGTESSQREEDGASRGRRGAATGGDAEDAASGDFIPRRHEDSGGGSERFRVKGGDNSVQDFGDETGGRNSSGRQLPSTTSSTRGHSESGRPPAHTRLAISSSHLKKWSRSDSREATRPARPASAFTNPEGIPLLRREAAQADVASLRAEGDRGFVIYRAGDEVLAIAMAKEGGDRKVASLAGYPLA